MLIRHFWMSKKILYYIMVLGELINLSCPTSTQPIPDQRSLTNELLTKINPQRLGFWAATDQTYSLQEMPGRLLLHRCLPLNTYSSLLKRNKNSHNKLCPWMGTKLIPCSGHYLPLIVYSNAKSVEIPSIYMILALRVPKISKSNWKARLS